MDAIGVEGPAAGGTGRLSCRAAGVFSVDETITGLVEVSSKGSGFFFPNPGVENEVYEGAFCTKRPRVGSMTAHTYDGMKLPGVL